MYAADPLVSPDQFVAHPAYQREIAKQGKRLKKLDIFFKF